MNIEISFTEMILFIWGSIATIAAGHYRGQLQAAKIFINAFMRDQELRDDLVAKYKKHVLEGEQ